VSVSRGLLDSVSPCTFISGKRRHSIKRKERGQLGVGTSMGLKASPSGKGGSYGHHMKHPQSGRSPSVSSKEGKGREEIGEMSQV